MTSDEIRHWVVMIETLEDAADSELCKGVPPAHAKLTETALILRDRLGERLVDAALQKHGSVIDDLGNKRQPLIDKLRQTAEECSSWDIDMSVPFASWSDLMEDAANALDTL